MSQPIAVVEQPGQPVHPPQPTGPPPPGYSQPQQPGYPPQPGGPAGAYPSGPAPPPPEVWMPAVTDTKGDCPKGLEYLTMLDQVLVKTKEDKVEGFNQWEAANKYRILNSQGQNCYYAFEESNVLCRQICGTNRGFGINITDNGGKTMLSIKRPFRCFFMSSCCACVRCAQDEVVICAANGECMGYVRQACSALSPHYKVYDAQMEEKFEIWGPACAVCMCGGNVDFPVRLPNNPEIIARVTKAFSGEAKDLGTDKDSFGISFPQDLDVRLKATLLGAVFLIDFMYFEQSKNDKNQGFLGTTGGY